MCSISLVNIEAFPIKNLAPWPFSRRAVSRRILWNLGLPALFPRALPATSPAIVLSATIAGKRTYCSKQELLAVMELRRVFDLAGARPLVLFPADLNGTEASRPVVSLGSPRKNSVSGDILAHISETANLAIAMNSEGTKSLSVDGTTYLSPTDELPIHAETGRQVDWFIIARTRSAFAPAGEPFVPSLVAAGCAGLGTQAAARVLAGYVGVQGSLRSHIKLAKTDLSLERRLGSSRLGLYMSNPEVEYLIVGSARSNSLATIDAIEIVHSWDNVDGWRKCEQPRC